MFRIGDFSRIAQVSTRLLRFYDELGLFAPAHADASTGYRYYTLAQLAQLNRITVLKDLGFSLEQVRDIVQDKPSATELRAMLTLRRHDVMRTLAAEAQRLRHIETRIAQIESDGQLSSEDVVVRSVPAQRVLSLRRTVHSFEEAGHMIEVLRQCAKPLLPRRHIGQLTVVSHAPQYEQDELDLEFTVLLAEAAQVTLPESSPLTLGHLPAVTRMASCVRTGSPDEAHLLTSRIGAFLAQNGEALAGPSREVFLHLPASDRMHESVVEMQFPLQTPPAP